MLLKLLQFFPKGKEKNTLNFEIGQTFLDCDFIKNLYQLVHYNFLLLSI